MCYRNCTKGEIFFDGNDRHSFKKREGLFGRDEGRFSDTNAFTYIEPWACRTTPSAIVDCSRQRCRREVSSYIKDRERAAMQVLKKVTPELTSRSTWCKIYPIVF